MGAGRFMWLNMHLLLDEGKSNRAFLKGLLKAVFYISIDFWPALKVEFARIMNASSQVAADIVCPLNDMGWFHLSEVNKECQQMAGLVVGKTGKGREKKGWFVLFIFLF